MKFQVLIDGKPVGAAASVDLDDRATELSQNNECIN
jgi:hypothetical protein